MFKARFTDRATIKLNHPLEMRAWTRHLSIDEAELESLVAKVGASSAAVKKELVR